jgi:hypothetical protein
MSEQPPPEFRDWLLDQIGRDDPIGDLAQEVTDEDVDLETAVEEWRRLGRSGSADAVGAALREYEALRNEWLSQRALLTIRGVLYDLLVLHHAQTDCGAAGRHSAPCQALTFAFGYSSWERWVEVATLFDRDH